MVQTESGKLVFDGLTEDGRIAPDNILLEDGRFTFPDLEIISSDVGIGVDATSEIIAFVSNAETGAGADALAESSSSRLESETGAGVDALISILKVIAKYGTDTGVGVDAASERLAALIQTETGSGVDAETRVKLINVLYSADEGTGAEAIASLLAEIEGTDTGMGLEVLGSRLLGSSDAGTGVDALSILEDVIGIEAPYTAKLGGVSLWIPPLGSQGFTITKEENDIPRFSFTLQNCSVNRTALEDHLDDEFVIYQGVTPIFTGLINCDQIEYLSIDRIKVNGFAEWIGLGYLIYKRMADADAESADAIFIRDDPSSWTDRTTEAGNDTINDVTVTFNSAGDGIYIGDLDRFNSLKVKYSTKGEDAGLNWTMVEDTAETHIRSLASDNGYLYAGTSPNGKIYRTSNGTDWTMVEDTTETSILSLKSFDGYLYAGTSPNGKIYRTSNGTDWTMVEDTAETHIRSLASDNGYLYAGTGVNDKMYRTSNGTDWTMVEDTTQSYIGSSPSFDGIYCLASFDGYLYVGTGVNGKIYRAPDMANITIQYSKGSDVWDTLDCVDESRHFTNDAGTYFIFMPTLPSDWAKDTVNSSTKYWIRITIASGSYTINPKLDRIWISQTDVCRVQFENTAADTILGYLLADTDYSEDVTDQCPSDVIPAIRGEYESRLHWIAGLINALEWEDVNGATQPYHWWIDDSKKVHVKQIRGTTYGDVTALLSILGNRLNYFNIANRIFGLGGGTSINQYRAITEDQSAQDSLGAIRETTYRDSRLFDYALLKGQARKLLTQSKVAQEQIQCTMPIYDWFEGGYDICDIIKLHQPLWGIPDEREYTIRRADISLSGVKLDVGIGREHLDNLQGDIQQQLAIHDVYMQGETSTFQTGIVEENYQRVDDTTVYPVKMVIEIPSNTKAINKALISWKLGPYRADVVGTGTGGGHAHDPASPNTGTGGGHAHGDFVGLGGGHTPTELGQAHVHDVDVDLNMVLTKRDGYLPETKTVSYESAHTHTNPNTETVANHRHTIPATDGPDDTADAATDVYYGSHCDVGDCVDWVDTAEFAEASHYHLNTGKDTGWDGSHYHVQGVTGSGGGHDHTFTTHSVILSYLRDIQLGIVASANDNPAHIHTINTVNDHNDHGIETLPDFSLSVPGTDTEPDFSLDLNYGMKEIPGGTIMQIFVNGISVGSYDGDVSDLKIRGFLTNGRNDVALQPAVGQNHKGSAQMDCVVKIFTDVE